MRLLMAFLILAVPTSAEVHANATNSMAFLALLAFLVLVAAPPDTKAGRVFDVAVLCLGGATGAFAVFLLPVAVLMYWIRRRRWSAVLLGIECSAAIVQAVAIVETAAGTRSSQPLGATPMLLFRIVGGQVIVSPLLGMKFLIVRPAIANLVCAVAFCGALLLLVYVVCRAPLELRLFMVFTVTLLAAALRSPLASLTEPQWPVLLFPGCGIVLGYSGYFVLLGVRVDAGPREARGDSRSWRAGDCCGSVDWTFLLAVSAVREFTLYQVCLRIPRRSRRTRFHYSHQSSRMASGSS